ncbi:MAG: protein translocase subunit SecD [Burkholderiaceae bacterium]|jgi:preprotein translocase subunit SecD|nr:protein translocase subunit SecD [Burkholderiaceae bacterium]
MNRYPLWKYIIIAVALVVAVLYTLPNFFGEAPAVQVSAAKVTVKVDTATEQKIESALQAAGVPANQIGLAGDTVLARFSGTDTQLKAKDAIERALNPDPSDPNYTVALNLVPRSPAWLAAINAKPMYLGLDLRGGVHFTLQVDMASAITRRLDSLTSDIRTALREKDVRYGGIERDGQTIRIRARDAATLAAVRSVITDQMPDLQLAQSGSGDALELDATYKPEALYRVQDQAIKQNITTLHNRVNELGVAEPVIQQQGADRVVVELPGVQDTAQAKEILGRTATLEMRLTDDSAEARTAAQGSGPVPFGDERFPMTGRDGKVTQVIVKKQVLVTGENLTDAQPGFDSQSQAPSVNLTMDAKGGRIMRDVSRDNLNKGMAIILFEKGKGQVISDATIRGELGTRFQISGSMSVNEANTLALLLRAGALAAPMDIVEERTIGPSLGADNIARGFHSVVWGFVAICVFMCIYYMLFGAFSSLALAFNLLLLVALLSMLQATLTLPGMAAMALALGMAIDSNVLINERVREELRGGASPQAAIHSGYDRAWATILDSNVTSLIAGLSLLAFGSGPVRGFAVVHCLGILTSMFSAVFFSRGLVNLWYGRQRKLKSVAIGTVWRPAGTQLTSEGHQV